jgi:hypothetical protein
MAKLIEAGNLKSIIEIIKKYQIKNVACMRDLRYHNPVENYESSLWNPVLFAIYH